MQIVANSDPVRRPARAFMLRAAIPDLGPDKYEQLWSEQISATEFEVCCIPFFADDIAFGDVVVAEEADDYVVAGVMRRSGERVMRVAVVADEVLPVHARIHDILTRREYLHEWFAPGYVAISLNPADDHRELWAEIRTLGAAVEIEVTPLVR